jgi:signal transduction histidine kinase
VKPYSLRRRLVVALTAVMSAVFVTLGVLLYAGVRDAAWRQYDDALLRRARAFSALVEHSEEGYETERPSDLADSFVDVRLPDGRVDSWRRKPLALAAELVGPVAYHDITLPDGRPGRAVAIRFLPRDEVGGAQRVTLVLAESTEDVDRSIRWMGTLFIIVGVAALAAIAALVWWLVGRGLQPLQRLARDIDTITDKTLATRLAVDNQPVELHAPIRKLNDLLTRLETSFARERQFTADVSHELRTPLAGLRTLLEVTALADRSTEDYRNALTSAHSVVLQLGALVENLLMLARLDAGHVSLATTDVDLHDLVAECWGPHEALAQARSLTFRNLATGTLATDREKLRLVIGNLLANAAEYTEEGGWIEVASSPAAPIAVTDSGPALPDEHKIFDRLWRGDAARTGTGVHCGIGLALARSLCSALAMSLSAENSGDGSVRFVCAHRASAARSDQVGVG